MVQEHAHAYQGKAAQQGGREDGRKGDEDGEEDEDGEQAERQITLVDPFAQGGHVGEGEDDDSRPLQQHKPYLTSPGCGQIHNKHFFFGVRRRLRGPGGGNDLFLGTRVSGNARDSRRNGMEHG
jgi:hypothetical protein